VETLSGAACPKGESYVRQELTNPRRAIATSVPVDGGELPLVSVRLTAPIPKGEIFAVMAEINKRRVAAPTHIGQVLIPDVLGLGSDVIVTKNVPAKAGGAPEKQ